MSRNLSASADLASKFAVGEIVDMVGVPNYYDAGDSKWLRTNTWVPAIYVPDAVVTQLANSNSALVALSDNLVINETNAHLPGLLPPAVVGSTACFSYISGARSYASAAFVVRSDGFRVVSTGLTSGISGNEAGGNHIITSDGTTFWDWAPISASAFGARSSTDGLTWSAVNLTGLPTFVNLLSNFQLGGMSQNISNSSVGDVFQAQVSHNGVAAWCGARHLLIGINGSNQYIATRSSNGTSWGGDESTTVLGSSTVGASSYCWWYRNGNNFFLTVGSVNRFSGDGGVTWGSTTGTGTVSSSQSYRVNRTDPARLLSTDRSSVLSVSTNSGSSWTGVTSPTTVSTITHIEGRGSTWVLTAAGSFFVSTNDGTSWTTLNAPLGLGSPSAVYADANRWYMYSASGNQIATSTDLSNWTIRNISNPAPTTALPGSIAAVSSSTVAMVANGEVLCSTDGGVTWRWAAASYATTATAVGATKLIANTVGRSCFIGGNTALSGTSPRGLYIDAADLTAGAKGVRGSSATVSSLRTNATAYVRVA